MKGFAILLMSCISLVTAAPTHEAGTLIVFRLTVESSYAANVEHPARDRFDTIQWWIGQHGAWRIKTYATDHDIHPYLIDSNQPREALRELAYSNSKKVYGDVIASTVSIEVPAGASDSDLAQVFRAAGLSGRFEWVDAGYLLWLPDDGDYITKTKPRTADGEPGATDNPDDAQRLREDH